MEIEVRSDFSLALNLRDASGQVMQRGELTEEGDWDAESLDVDISHVPHLQRANGSKTRLATFDVANDTIHVERVDGRLERGHTKIRDIPWGSPKQFRWLSDGTGFAISDDSGVYLVEAKAKGKAKATPVVVLEDADIDAPLGYDIEDVRVVPAGLVVKVAQRHRYEGPERPLAITPSDLLSGAALPGLSLELGKGWHRRTRHRSRHRSQLYFVPVRGIEAGDPVALLPESMSVKSAMPLADGTVAAAVHRVDDALGFELWTVTLPTGDTPTAIERDACEDQQCDVYNWAPGADAPVFATPDGVFIGAGTKPLPGPELGQITMLWRAPDGRVLAADNDRVTVWAPDRSVQWTWNDPEGEAIASAQFDVDTDAVVLATTSRLLRLREGEAELLHKIDTPEEVETDEDEWSEVEEVHTRELDGVVPLPGGAVAFGVVEVDTSQIDS